MNPPEDGQAQSSLGERVKPKRLACLCKYFNCRSFICCSYSIKPCLTNSIPVLKVRSKEKKFTPKDFI
jgi:hypothetical protein